MLLWGFKGSGLNTAVISCTAAFANGVTELLSNPTTNIHFAPDLAQLIQLIWLIQIHSQTDIPTLRV
jgi:hypothetical protein